MRPQLWCFQEQCVRGKEEPQELQKNVHKYKAAIHSYMHIIPCTQKPNYKLTPSSLTTRMAALLEYF